VKRYRWVFWAIAALSAVLAVRYAAQFPWASTADALRHAHWGLLAAAGAASLLSVSAKAWAWHLLLRPAWPHRWADAQVATIAGAAVSVVSVSVSGEAVRMQALAGRSDPPLGPLVSSIVWSRVTEAIALAVFLAVSLLVLPPLPWIRAARVVAVIALVVVSVLWLTGAWRALVTRLPARWQRTAGVGTASGTPSLPAPVALGVANWALQWLAYHGSIVGVGIDAPPGAALGALVAANLGGLLRLTPGNVGVLQASVVMGLLPFGVHADRALAAGLALQAVQVAPVLLAAALVATRVARPPGAVSAPAAPISTTGAGSEAGSGTGGSEG
jgi:uncharacterized membrane protein YbhN (UPF0104 family)